MSVPSFFIKGTLLVTLQSAGGFDRLASRLEETLAIVSLSAIAAIGLFPDADHYSPERRLQEIRRQVGGRVPGLILPDQAGTVGMGQPKAGVFVLPDNRSQGRLEDLLEDCARVVYPASLHAAADFVSYASANELTDEDQVELRRPAGELKARLGCVSALLKPGRTIQVSLQDNRWISEPALRLPRIQGINGFLDSLLQP